MLFFNVWIIVFFILGKCEVGVISMYDVYKSCVIGVEMLIEGFVGKEGISGIKVYNIWNKKNWY